MRRASGEEGRKARRPGCLVGRSSPGTWLFPPRSPPPRAPLAPLLFLFPPELTPERKLKRGQTEAKVERKLNGVRLERLRVRRTEPQRGRHPPLAPLQVQPTWTGCLKLDLKLKKPAGPTGPVCLGDIYSLAKPGVSVGAQNVRGFGTGFLAACRFRARRRSAGARGAGRGGPNVIYG